MTVEPLLVDSAAKLRAALPDELADLYAAIIDEALPELQRPDDAVVRRVGYVEPAWVIR
jgi:uncharacterized protein (DUF2267 family)